VRIPIGVKIGLGFGIVLLVLAGVFWSGYGALNRVTNAYETQVLRIEENARLAEEVGRLAATEAFAVSAYMLTGDAAYRPEFQRASAQAAQALEQLNARSVSARAHELVDRVTRLHDEYIQLAGPYVGVAGSAPLQTSGEDVGVRINNVRTSLQAAVDELIAYEELRRSEEQAGAA